MYDLIGKTVGPYRILEQIGAGGMATVYKAYQPSMDRYIAVKVLPAHLSRDPDFTKRFQREARAISRLEHSRILPVYDYGEYEGITYIAMRYIKAGTLKDRVSMGGLSLEEINHLISQIGGALDYAHRMGVIHRDVKPANILIDDQGDVYLSDFGLARIMEPTQQLTESGVGLGTPAYMSPEQGQGIKVDHRSDIYSLGVILYEMLTGRVPFEAETPMAVVFQHIHGDLPLPHFINPNTPEPVERVVLKALAKDPADRYQTASEMAQALNAAVRIMSVEEQQQTMVDKVAPVQQDTSIGTRLQRIWHQPRGKVMLAGGALATVMLLGFLLFQLPGNITILAPNPNQESTTVLAPTTTSLATQQVTQLETSQPMTQVPSLLAPELDWVIRKDYTSHGILLESNPDPDSGYTSNVLDKDIVFNGPFRVYVQFQSGTGTENTILLIGREAPEGGQWWQEARLEVTLGSDGSHVSFFIRNGKQLTGFVIDGIQKPEDGIVIIDFETQGKKVWILNSDGFVLRTADISQINSLSNGLFPEGIKRLELSSGPNSEMKINELLLLEPTSTTTNSVTPLPAPQGELVFDENFDDGIANGIIPNGTNWEIVDDNRGGKLFQIDGKPAVDWDGFGLGLTTIVDGTIEYKVRVVDYGLSSRGAVLCNFRVTPERTYLFDLAVGAKVVSMNYQGTDTNYVWRQLDNAQAPHIFDKNKWYVVRIDVEGNEFTAYIDGKKVLSTTNEIIKSGEINFRVEPNTVAQLDDIRVWAQP